MKYLKFLNVNCKESDYESLIFHCLQRPLSADGFHVWEIVAKVLNDCRRSGENSTGKL
jgi:hypothetical protein